IFGAIVQYPAKNGTVNDYTDFIIKAHENETIGSVDQRLPKKFAVMYAAKNVDLDARTEPLEDLRDQVFRALLGWSPDSEHSSIEFVEGAILATSDMLVQWTDVFVTETILCDQ
ncbi:MAG: hypothetical protein JKY93_02460, partial [Gammaproteobacteria bacterium]|nr:hypothetical protein [Gammaproteobacteria bacterium]